jgi:P22 tail accessory factor
MTEVTLDLGLGRPKRDIIEQAYRLCGIAVDDLDPDLLSDGLRDLNIMMMEGPWDTLGYEQPLIGDGDLADASGLLNAYTPATIHELAMRLAPNMGKALSPEALARVRTTRRTLDALIAVIPQMKMRGGIHLGAGRQRHGYWRGGQWSSNATETE